MSRTGHLWITAALFAAAAAPCTGAGNVKWAAGFDDALARAKQRHCPILVFVMRPGCVTSRRVERSVLPGVPSLSDVVCVKLHADKQRNIINRLPKPRGRYQLPLIALTDWNFADLGHTAGPVEPKILEQALQTAVQTVGPELTLAVVRQLEALLDEADGWLHIERIPEALGLYGRVAGIRGNHPVVLDARKKRDKLLELGQDRLREAADKLEMKDPDRAALIFGRLARDFKSTKTAARALDYIRRLRNDPKGARAVRQMNEELAADELLHQAQDLSRAGKHRAALRTYRKLMRLHALSAASDKAGPCIKRLEQTVAQLDVKGRVSLQERLNGLMSMADNLEANGRPAEAATHYERVVLLAPDTPEARTARAALERLRKP